MSFESASTETMPLWPDAGTKYGTGKNLTYTLAAKGEFPGAFKAGDKWLVSKRAFYRHLENPQAA